MCRATTSASGSSGIMHPGDTRRRAALRHAYHGKARRAWESNGKLRLSCRGTTGTSKLADLFNGDLQIRQRHGTGTPSHDQL